MRLTELLESAHGVVTEVFIDSDKQHARFVELYARLSGQTQLNMLSTMVDSEFGPGMIAYQEEYNNMAMLATLRTGSKMKMVVWAKHFTGISTSMGTTRMLMRKELPLTEEGYDEAVATFKEAKALIARRYQQA